MQAAVSRLKQPLPAKLFVANLESAKTRGASAKELLPMSQILQHVEIITELPNREISYSRSPHQVLDLPGCLNMQRASSTWFNGTAELTCSRLQCMAGAKLNQSPILNPVVAFDRRTLFKNMSSARLQMRGSVTWVHCPRSFHFFLVSRSYQEANGSSHLQSLCHVWMNRDVWMNRER